MMSAIAIIMAIALAGATCVLSYLAAVSVMSPGCIGRDLLVGYRSDTLDFWALPLFSVCVVAVIEKARRNPKTSELLERLDVPVLELASFRFTYGMFLIYSVLFGFIAVSASMTEFSAKRYMAISNYCQSA